MNTAITTTRIPYVFILHQGNTDFIELSKAFVVLLYALFIVIGENDTIDGY
jgi:hypothetical protein